MMRRIGLTRFACALVALSVSLAPLVARGLDNLPAATFPDPTGTVQSVSTADSMDGGKLFIQALGTNGRACATCHVPSDGWGLTPATVNALFDSTGGLHPLFRPDDAAVSPLADVSTTEARAAAYALLRSRGLIRVGMAPPAGAEFVVEAVDDPYGFANPSRLSLFRRPLPATNLTFLSTVMWDGRETFGGLALHYDLSHQANGVTPSNAQAAETLTPDQQLAIVDFEISTFTAQLQDFQASALSAPDVSGGAAALADPNVAGHGGPPGFTLFNVWARPTPPVDTVTDARQAVAIGQDIFNNRKFGPQGITCSTCHDVRNVGSASTMQFHDTGVANGAVRPRNPALPLYTLRCPASNTVVHTTDPGRALVTGRCADIGRFKVPTLRGLAARAPYFHDGSAATLSEVVLYYDDVFRIGLRALQKNALVAFLRSL
jgi:cytochrome c peroxidase